MSSKPKVYDVTFPDFQDQANIKGFAQWKGISETEVVREIVKRYFLLSFSERSALERKVRWSGHRNKGFRRLTSFEQPRIATHVLPPMSTNSKAATRPK